MNGGKKQNLKNTADESIPKLNQFPPSCSQGKSSESHFKMGWDRSIASWQNILELFIYCVRLPNAWLFMQQHVPINRDESLSVFPPANSQDVIQHQS